MTGRMYITAVTLGLLLLSSPSYSDKRGPRIRCEHPPSELLLLRHGCRQLCDDDNSPLSPKGKEQAQKLAERLAGHLEGHDLVAIFVTKRVRTQETASLLAESKKLKLSEIDPTGKAAVELVDKICSGAYASKAVLYVGHSTTLGPALRHLDPEYVYEEPSCGEGWFINFKLAEPKIDDLPPSGIQCEKPCCRKL